MLSLYLTTQTTRISKRWESNGKQCRSIKEMKSNRLAAHQNFASENDKITKVQKPTVIDDFFFGVPADFDSDLEFVSSSCT